MSEYVKSKGTTLIIDFNLLALHVRNEETLKEAEQILRESFKEIAYAMLQATGEPHKV
jgi:hypothetical protein